MPSLRISSSLALTFAFILWGILRDGWATGVTLSLISSFTSVFFKLPVPLDSLECLVRIAWTWESTCWIATRELLCGKWDWFGWESTAFTCNNGVWDWSPSSLFAWSSVCSSDLPWLRSSCSVKLSHRARLRRRLSLISWMICVRISLSTLGKLQSDAFVYNRR